MGNLNRSGGGPIRRAQNAIERRVQTSHEEMGLQQSRFLARAITWALLGTTAAGLAWLALAQTDEVVMATGKLQPIGDVKTIQMPVGGVLETMLVKDGQRVSKGQVLLRLDNEATLDRQQSLRATIAAKRSQLRLKEVEMARYLNLNDTEQALTRQNLVLETEILERLEGLKAVGASAELQYLQQRNKVQEVAGELSKLKVDRLRQIAILEQAVEQLRGDLADLGSKLTELRVNIRYQDVRSPADGVEIESIIIGFVQVGRPAEISIDSFPATDFGVLLGTVKGIGSDALPPDERHQTYRFPATISLDSQQLKLKSGRSLPLQVGMSLSANIKLRKVTYLQLLLGEFKNKTDSLKRL